jgi:hypothetical protein
MLRQGPISLTLHAAFEPLLAALFIAAPFLFGFSDDGSATAVSIIVGIGVLVIGMSTCWPVSLIKVIPVAAHLVLDIVIAAFLIATPFLFGFSNETTPVAYFLIMGVATLLLTLATRWYRSAGGDGADAVSEGRRGRRRRSRPATDAP